MRKPLVVHLVPFDGVGGVEAAARTMLETDQPDLDFQVEYLLNHRAEISRSAQLMNPVVLVKAGWRIARQKPDLLILSLWRSALSGIIVKLLRPRTKLVLFLHSPANVHVLDRWATWCTLHLSEEVWADSQATLVGRVQETKQRKSRVISFVGKKLERAGVGQPLPHFIFWGRLHGQKGLDRSLSLFAMLAKFFPDATYEIIGPDGGEFTRLRELSESLDVAGQVNFRGAMEFDEIKCYAAGASFYLQLSRLEGMAMSVVEAMQLGLVPIVAPVGEITDYCQQGVNSIVFESNEQAVKAVKEVLADEQRFMDIRDAALKTWAGKPTYAESMLVACRSFLDLD